MNPSDNARNVFASFVGCASVTIAVGGFRIADIVEGNTVNVVVLRYFAAQLGDVVGCTSLCWLHEHILPCCFAEFGVLLHNAGIAEAVLLLKGTEGYADYPCMQLHASTMTLFHGKSQWVIARMASVAACQTFVPRLYVRRVDDTAAYSRLHDHGIDVGLVQLIQNRGQFMLLDFYTCIADSLCLWPIEPLDSRQPYRTYLTFRKRRLRPLSFRVALCRNSLKCQ